MCNEQYREYTNWCQGVKGWISSELWLDQESQVIEQEVNFHKASFSSQE